MRSAAVAPRRAGSRCTAERESARSQRRHTAGSGQRARTSVDGSCCRKGWSPRIVPLCTGLLVRFRFALALAHVGPEARARRTLTAVLLTPFSPGSDENQQLAHSTDRLTQTFPHALSHPHVHDATRRRRDGIARQRCPWSSVMSPWHAVSFRSPRERT
jgi:hypothetical protein